MRCGIVSSTDQKPRAGVLAAHPNIRMKKARVLILCTGNSARSQMAEALLRHDAGDRFEVFSAGVKPSGVRPEAIAVMRELGIDLSGQRSKHVSEFSGQTFDYVLTVCNNARENCPIFPGGTVSIHHNFADPAAVSGSGEGRPPVFHTPTAKFPNYFQTFPRGWA